MAIEIKVPELGESVVEATIGTWHIKPGDAVRAGDLLVELETDKVDLEVAAEQDGVLSEVLFGEGDDVEVGQVIALLETSGNGAAVAAPPTAAATETGAAPAAAGPAEDTAVTPVARRLAEAEGVDVGRVTGSGPKGRVTKEDVEAAVAQRQQPDPPVTAAPPPPTRAAAPATVPDAAPEARVDTREERVRLSRRRRTIARRLVEAQQTAAMLTTFNEVDMSQVMALRARRKVSFKERTGESLSISAFFVKAVVGALRAFPRLNAEIDGDEMVLKHYYDIGVAIGAEEGLVVPVLRDADRLGFAAIAGQIRTFAQRVEDGSLSLEDLRGGTFTITNGGVFGSMLSTPILNPPQVGILGMHNIVDRPVAINGEVLIRPVMYLALSYDHRIVDGREAVQFLVRVKELVEDPEALLLEG